MKNNSVSANYENIQKRKKEIEGQLKTLLPQEFHFPQKSIQESTAQFGEKYINNVLQGYLEAALWAEGEDGEFDVKSIETDIAPESIEKAKSDIKRFLEKIGDEAYEANWGEFFSGEGAMTPDQIGHDLLLTRNGHGSGFWDRGLDEIGEKLSDAAREMGSVDVYEGDDGIIYIEGGIIDESGLGAVANWAGNSLGKWGQKQADKLAKTGQNINNRLSQAGQDVSNTVATAQNKYQAGQRAANIGKIKKQKDAQYSANKDRLIRIKQQIDSLGQQYKQITGKPYKGGAIANPIREDETSLSLNETFLANESEKIKEKFENWGMQVNEINDGSVSFTDRNGANMSIPREDANDIIEPAIMIRTANVNETIAFDESDMMDKYKDQMDLQHGLNVAQNNMGQAGDAGSMDAFRDMSGAINTGDDAMGDEDAMHTAYSDLEKQLAALEEVSDEFLDTMSAKQMASDDIGSDFIDPTERGDIEDFRAGVETADNVDPNSPEMKIAKRNHLARLGKMKMDKLSELNKLMEGDLNELGIDQLSQKFGDHPNFNDVKDKLTQRFMGQEHPIFKADGGSGVYKVRSTDPKYYTRTYELGMKNTTVDNKKGGYDHVDQPTGSITFNMMFEFAAYNPESPQKPDLGTLEAYVTFNTKSGKRNILVKGTNTGTLNPVDRRSATIFVKGLKSALQEPLKNFGRDISSGKNGGYSEINRETLQKATQMTQELKANDFYIH